MTSLTTVRVRYQTIEIGNTDIHICTLRDNQQFSDPDDEALNLGICSASWPMFGVIWPSSLVLANHMLDYDMRASVPWRLAAAWHYRACCSIIGMQTLRQPTIIRQLSTSLIAIPP
ncbi:hypothetical protein [Psychrobacter immobilis]|uniref:hypothetical protein n=1 Tax=Psychrobacter immobilis TaxID=498 RepID=UPI001918B06C|nr:hypothetical protein [Psychrobacter immobilis]